MSAIRIILILLLAIGLTACKGASNVKQAKTLMDEGNRLLNQDSKNIAEWVDIYRKAFNPENRAKFPGNREWLQTQADRLITIYDESSRLQNAAAEKYEQAERLAENDTQRKFIIACASNIRKTVEVNELFKAQMRLVSDQEIKDEKTFNEKFLNLLRQSQQKQKELDKELESLRALVKL